MARKRKFSSDASERIVHDELAWQPNGRSTYPEQVIGDTSSTLPLLPPITAEMSKTVFTHPSTVPQCDIISPSASYDRLEFLGDAYIELMATRLIWERFDTHATGRLSQLRELLVKNETLSEIAVQYGFDKQVRVKDDVKANPRLWGKVKGDLVEAYVAAVVLADDKMGGSGFQAAESWLRRLWTPKLKGQLQEKVPDLRAKECLAQKLVSKGIRLEYQQERPMVRLEGGLQTYFYGVFLTGWGYTKQHLGSGQGLSKTAAGNRAAGDAMQHPLVESLTMTKKKHDQTRLQEVCGSIEDRKEEEQEGFEAAENESDRTAIKPRKSTPKRELVEKKRNMFMSTEFG